MRLNALTLKCYGEYYLRQVLPNWVFEYGVFSTPIVETVENTPILETVDKKDEDSNADPNDKLIKWDVMDRFGNVLTTEDVRTTWEIIKEAFYGMFVDNLGL